MNWEIINFITFQIWAAFTLIGVCTTALYGGPAITIAPWVGAFVGIAVNELLPGYVNEGIKLV